MGRQPKSIDWDLVDKLIERQCTAMEIAGAFDMDDCTLYRRIREKYDTNFENFARSKYNNGKKLLRSKQFEMAMSGNTRLLEKLGELYLDQREEKDSKQNITININGKLGSGLGVSAERLPNTDNNGTESGN